MSGSRLRPRSKNPKISGILKFKYIFHFLVQNWLPIIQRPFPLNFWWKNGPFWCKIHCSSSKTVDFSIFSGGTRKKIGPMGGSLSDMTPNTLGYNFSYIFRKRNEFGGPGPQKTRFKVRFHRGGWLSPPPHASLIGLKNTAFSHNLRYITGWHFRAKVRNQLSHTQAAWSLLFLLCLSLLTFA